MRKHVLWATTVLTIALTFGMLASDLVMRSDPETYDQYLAAGAFPSSWDVVASVALGIWLLVAWESWKHRREPA